MQASSLRSSVVFNVTYRGPRVLAGHPAPAQQHFCQQGVIRSTERHSFDEKPTYRPESLADGCNLPDPGVWPPQLFPEAIAVTPGSPPKRCVFAGSLEKIPPSTSGGA
jgi:hypothetical protein